MQKNNLHNTFHPQPNPNHRGMDVIKQYNSFKQDPLYFLLQNRGISIPEQYRNDPRGRDSMGRYTSRDGYSGHENREEMKAHLQMAIDSAPNEAEKAVLRDYLNKL